MSDCYFSIGHRDWPKARFMPQWYRFLVLKRGDETAEWKTCEICEKKITVQQWEDGDYYHDRVWIYGEVDDEFFIHIPCWSDHCDRIAQAWAKTELKLREQIYEYCNEDCYCDYLEIAPADPEIEKLLAEEEAIERGEKNPDNPMKGFGW